MIARLEKTIAALVALILFATTALAQENYRIRAGDTLNIEVLEDPGLNRSTIVLPDGQISFPFAGSIRVSGRTVGQVEAAVASGISSQFAVAPNVFVSVSPTERQPTTAAVEPATVEIYLIGEISSPGPKSMPEGTTILQALSASGGFTNFAAKKRVQLRRTNPATGLQSVYEINYDALENGAELRNDVPLQSGDVILVPERRLFE